MCTHQLPIWMDVNAHPASTNTWRDYWTTDLKKIMFFLLSMKTSITYHSNQKKSCEHPILIWRLDFFLRERLWNSCSIARNLTNWYMTLSFYLEPRITCKKNVCDRKTSMHAFLHGIVNNLLITNSEQLAIFQKESMKWTTLFAQLHMHMYRF